MKFRILFACALALTAGLVAPSTYARGISVDAGINCALPLVTQAADGSITLPSGGSLTTNSANAGVPVDVNLPVWACTDNSGLDTGATALAFDATHSVLYTWIDATAQSQSVVTSEPLSNLSGLEAQVNVFSLTGSLSGDYEVVFNYGQTASFTCPATSAPSLTWFGSTYNFTGGGGLSGPCDADALNDFLFGSTGKLLGSVDSFGNVDANGLAPVGWSAPTSSSPVPEPDTLALLSCAGVFLLLLPWLRARVRRERHVARAAG